MIDAKFPNARAIKNHLEQDPNFSSKSAITGNDQSKYYVEYGVANKIAKAFSNKTFAPIAIKAKVDQAMASALRRPTYLEADLIESISASLARLTNVKPENVDMRAA